MTEHESQEHLAQCAADRAVDRVFKLLFGVDLDDQAQINEFRTDMQHIRKLRRLSDKIGATTVAVFVAALVTGVIGVLWSGVLRIVRGHTG
jgi:hypothetical protein